MESYRTVRKEGCGEYEVKRSRFLCYAAPVRSQDEAAAFTPGTTAPHTSCGRAASSGFRMTESLRGRRACPSSTCSKNPK